MCPLGSCTMKLNSTTEMMVSVCYSFSFYIDCDNGTNNLSSRGIHYIYYKTRFTYKEIEYKYKDIYIKS